MRIIKGIAASSGIGFGRAFLYLHEKVVVPHLFISSDRVASEQRRFDKTLDKVAQDFQSLYGKATTKEYQSILETQQLMLSDPDFITAVHQKIESDLVCAEWAVESVVASLMELLETASDSTLRERSIDLYDIGWRVIKRMMGKKRLDLASIEKDSILVADTLLPSEALSLNNLHVKAIALNVGGKTSHVAILARALQIPAVVGLGKITEKIRTQDEIIVDGNLGEVVVRPNSETSLRMKERHNRYLVHEKKLQELSGLETITKDGHKVALKANIETIDEIQSVLSSGAGGIGLFRSEFLFLKPGGASEEEQFLAYKEILEKMSGVGPVTIRTIDVGGDKVIPGMEGLSEENPILGWRAVRFSLSRKDIFRIQLRALLRASPYGKLKIMFPMISGAEELDDVLTVLEQVKDECRSSQIPFDETIEVGTMIEVPSAALCADLLAPKTDFFSIGTNDLIQYTIAVDRGNEKIAYLYQPFHLGVLRLLKMVVNKGHNANIPVAICGEMAGDPLSTLLLLGLGVDEFSVSPQSLLEIKNIIRSVTLKEAKEFTEKVLKMNSYININAYVKEWMHDKFEDLFPL